MSSNLAEVVRIRVAHTAREWSVLADGAPCAALSNEADAIAHARRIASATLRAGLAVLLQLDAHGDVAQGRAA